jgi:alpha-L-fucosidase
MKNKFIRYGLYAITAASIISATCTHRNREANIAVESADSNNYLNWFKEAKFGMFIHWGPYSRLAGEWNGKHVEAGKEAEWIMKDLSIPVEKYRELAHQMNPVRFDARGWVHMARAAGMKYLVITAKHHDGFAMYRSSVSKYNIVDWTTFKRDPLKELSQACAEEGIRFCFYYSQREDWDHPGGYGNNWDYDNDWGDDFYDHEKFTKYLREKAEPQLRELLTNYGPVGLVWFDRGMYTPEQGKELVSLVKGIQPATLINSRVGNYGQELLGDYQSMGDNGMPPGGLKEYWESAQTLNQTWGYSKFDTLWKSPETVIQRLVEIVSRGGNYLLNIGPEGNGEIPEATVEILGKVGPWVERNSESIYGTTANPFGELPWGYCTVRANKLYFFIRDWPKDCVLTIPRLSNHVKSAYLLRDKSVKLTVAQSENQIRVTLPLKPIDYPITVLAVELEGSPVTDPPIVFQNDTGSIELNYLTVITNGKTMTRFNRKGGFHISKWTGPDDSAKWIIHLDKAGKFRVNISYAAKKDWEGKKYKIIIGSSSFEKSVISTGDWFDYHNFPVGYIELKNPGDYTIIVRPCESGSTSLMWLQSVVLNPVKCEKSKGWGAIQ